MGRWWRDGEHRLTRAQLQWKIKLNDCAVWHVGGYRNTTVELSDQTLDDLEAQARPWLVDIEILRKTNSLIRYIHVQVGSTRLARYLNLAGSPGVSMLGRICYELVDQKAQRNRLVSRNHQMAESEAYLMCNGFLQVPAQFAREVGDVDKPDSCATP